MEKEGYGWHFHNGKLRDGSPVPREGLPLVYTGPIVICRSGLHLSLKASQALQYAPGPYLTHVRYRGLVDYLEDKLMCSERTILAQKDITDLLRLFARKQALSVAHLWDIPSVVREYLETGNGYLRHAAQNAAVSAAWSAARGVAWSAAVSVAWNAAESAAWSAAKSAAWSAATGAAESAAKSAAESVAKSAVRSAVQSAALSAADDMFDNMVKEEFGL